MISIIACISKKNRAIGYQNRLLYHIKEDMARFKELTIGHTIIMGRKTYESLPNGALPRRRNVVISSTLQEIEGCKVYPSLEDAIHAEIPDPLYYEKEESWLTSSFEVFIIGGESIYRQALPLADKLYLTIVDDEPQQADTFFPAINLTEWQEEKNVFDEWEEEGKKEMRNENGLSFSFLTLVRK